MDLQLMKRGLEYSRKNSKWIILFALFGASSYGAYKVYHSPSVARKRRRLRKIFGAFFSLIEAVSDSAETIGVFSRDLKEFLESDSDEIPNSLKQMSKIARSDEFSESLIMVSEALTLGILRGYRSETMKEGESEWGGIGFADRIMDRVLSNAGSGFVSVVVGSFARNLVLGFYDKRDSIGDGKASALNDGEGLSRWVDVVCSGKCKDFVADCIQVFVSTAVAAFLDKTMDINTYDEIFAGMTNPKHETQVRDMFVSVCNGAVETLVKTTHQVLTEKKTVSDPDPCSSSSCSVADHCECLNLNVDEFVNREKGSTAMKERLVFNKVQNSRWVTSVSSTLSVPSNRRFVLDMTGRVTFETFKSLVEFLLWKLSDGFRRSVDSVHDQVAAKGMQVVQYFSAKSSVVVTVFLALYLHIMSRTRALLPA